MLETIYIVVRRFGKDVLVECFKNKENALEYAKTQALDDHQYFNCEENFEDCCFRWSSYVIWNYEAPNVSISVLASDFTD